MLYQNALIAPAGTYSLDDILVDCPDPESTVLDDNYFLTVHASCPRILLGEVCFSWTSAPNVSDYSRKIEHRNEIDTLAGI